MTPRPAHRIPPNVKPGNQSPSSKDAGPSQRPPEDKQQTLQTPLTVNEVNAWFSPPPYALHDFMAGAMLPPTLAFLANGDFDQVRRYVLAHRQDPQFPHEQFRDLARHFYTEALRLREAYREDLRRRFHASLPLDTSNDRRLTQSNGLQCAAQDVIFLFLLTNQALEANGWFVMDQLMSKQLPSRFKPYMPDLIQEWRRTTDAQNIAFYSVHQWPLLKLYDPEWKAFHAAVLQQHDAYKNTRGAAVDSE